MTFSNSLSESGDGKEEKTLRLDSAAVEELMQHGIDLNLDEVVFLLIFIFLLQRILTKLW